MLEIRDASVTYRRRGHPFTAIEHVQLSVDAGERIGIVGRSGSGKTTIARLMLGLVAASAGEVCFEGEPIHGQNLQRLRSVASLVHQDPNSSLNPRMRIRRIIEEPLLVRASRAQLDAALEAVGLAPELSERYPHELSGGQRQRVAIARALIDDPRLLVADEPVSALDVLVRGQVLRVLDAQVRQRGSALVMISHDLAVVRDLCERVVVVDAGRIVEQGTVAEIFTSPSHPYTQQLLAASLSL